MTKPVCRQGHIGSGVCYWHSGPTPYTTVFSDGADTVMTNGQVTSIIGTIGIATCGHPTTAHTGSGTVITAGEGTHRLADSGANGGPYTATEGSPNVFAGD